MIGNSLRDRLKDIIGILCRSDGEELEVFGGA